MTGEDRGAAGDVGDHGVLRDHGDEVREVGVEVAEIVSLAGLRGRRRLPRGRRVQKKFGEKGCQASFFSRPPGRSRSRWREGARGAVLEHRSEARSAEVRAPVFAPVVPALQRRVGGADASVENGLARRSLAPTPGRGAQLASTAGACGGAFASDVTGPLATERSELRSPSAVSA